MKDSVKIIILHESVWQSYKRDIGTLVSTVAMVGIGVWLESSALQWIGGILAMLAIFVSGVNSAKNGSRMTIAEARERLNKYETEGLRDNVDGD